MCGVAISVGLGFEGVWYHGRTSGSKNDITHPPDPPNCQPAARFSPPDSSLPKSPSSPPSNRTQTFISARRRRSSCPRRWIPSQEDGRIVEAAWHQTLCTGNAIVCCLIRILRWPMGGGTCGKKKRKEEERTGKKTKKKKE